MTKYFVTSTVTATVQATTTATKNLCASTATHSSAAIDILGGNKYSDSISVASGSLPALQIKPYQDFSPEIRVVQQSGRLYLVRSGDTTYEPGTVALYVYYNDVGGQALFGDVGYIARNNFYSPPCTFQPVTCQFCNPGFSDLQCYNVNGDAFTPYVAQADRTLALYTANVPAGYDSVGLQTVDDGA